jgi:cytochrome c oxidase assembly factor CtaG
MNHTHMHTGSLPLTLALLATAGAGLLVRPRLKRGSFLAGLLAVWVAIASPLMDLDHRLLTMHMVSHLLLMTVGAPLILRSLPAWRSGHAVGHPVLCWLSSTATVIVWHLPAVFELALDSPAWHLAEQANFLAAGFLFWLPVLRPSPERSEWTAPVYLFLATLPCDVLSAFLVFCDRVVYPSYLTAPRGALSPGQDQEFAGALMWVWVTFVYCAPAVASVVRTLSPEAANV